MICSAAPWNRKLKIHSDTQFAGPPDSSGPMWQVSTRLSTPFAAPSNKSVEKKSPEIEFVQENGRTVTNTRQGVSHGTSWYVTRGAHLYFTTCDLMSWYARFPLCGLAWCPWVSLAVWIQTGCHDFCTFTTTILLVLYRLSFQELTTKNKNQKQRDLNSPKLAKKELVR